MEPYAFYQMHRGEYEQRSLASEIDVLQSFIGMQEQYPPMYSAIKVNGKKLYEYARAGKQVDVKPRNIEIYNIKLDSFDKSNNVIELTLIFNYNIIIDIVFTG